MSVTPRRGLLDAFSKSLAHDLAGRHTELNFGQKPKNQLGIFYIVVIILSLIRLTLGAVGQGLDIAIIISALFGLMLYALFAFFIFLNHRWAMVLACLMFLCEILVVIITQPSSLIAQLLFGFACLAFTWRAFLVATALKQGLEPDISAFD